VTLLACCNCSPCLFTVCVGKCPYPTLQQSISHCWKSSLSKHADGGGATPSFSCRLIYLQFTWESAPSHSPEEFATLEVSLPLTVELRVLCPLYYMPFYQLLVYYSFLFLGWLLVCPGDYANFSQGWLWENHVPLVCSPVGLPSRLGARAWQHRSPLVFSVHPDVGELCAGWGVWKC
jgi:hypothetical protein